MTRPEVSEFVGAMIAGVTETLRVQCAVEFTPGEPFPGGTKTIPCDIAAVIGLAGKSLRGSLVLGLSEQTFLRIMSGMLGDPCDVVTQDLQDGAGELLNIMFGAGKRRLNELGYEIEKAIPTVVRGKDLSIRHGKSQESVVVTFADAVGDFYLEIIFE